MQGCYLQIDSIQLADDAFAVQRCRSPETVSPPLIHSYESDKLYGFLTLQRVYTKLCVSADHFVCVSISLCS